VDSPLPGAALAPFFAALGHQLQRRRRLYEGGLWLACCGGSFLSLLTLGGRYAGPIAEVLFAVFCFASIGVTTWMVRRLGRNPTDVELARFVAEHDPVLGRALLSSVELTAELGQRPGAFSPTLVDDLIANTRRQTQRLDPVALARHRPIIGGIAAVGVVAACALVGLVSFPERLARGLGALLGRPGVYEIAAEPLLADLEVRLVYPAYTGRAPETMPSSSGDIIALAGTEVEISGRALLAVERARLHLDESGAVRDESVRVDGGRLRTHFQVHQAGSYRFLIASRGRLLMEKEPHSISLDRNHPPTVELRAPADALELERPRPIELDWSAEDDFGLGRADLVWQVGSGPEQRRPLYSPKSPTSPTRAEKGRLIWDLAELSLPLERPGVRVAYHVEANDLATPPEVGRSRTLYLTLSSPRDKFSAEEAALGELQEKILAALGNRLEAEHLDLPTAKRLHPEGEAILVATRPLLAEGVAHGKQGAIGAMQARLEKLQREEERLLKESAAQHGLESLSSRIVSEWERDALALDDLLGQRRLEELLRLGDEMAQARDRLKELMRQYKAAPSPELKRQIEAELRELERKLAELSHKAQRLAGELPDQYLNREAMGKNDLGGRLDEVRKLLAQGDLDRAMATLDRLSSSLDHMVSSMEQDLRGYRGERYGEEERSRAALESELADLQHDEKQLKEETEAVRQRSRERMRKRLTERGGSIEQRLKETLSKARKEVGSVERPLLPRPTKEELERAESQMGKLDRLIEESDLEEARALGRETDQALRSLLSEMGREAGGTNGPRREKTTDRMRKGEQLLREVVDDLERSVPKQSDLMSEEEARQLGDLARRQEATRKRAEALRKQLGQKGDGNPPQLGEQLRQATSHMEDAEGRLKRGEARGAQGKEEEALEQLGQMKRQMEEERRPRNQMTGHNEDKEPVRIPGADEYQVPKRYRQDLLDAMKRSAPSEYREQVKRYFEELTR
jgi:hypothetical protein